MISTHKMSNYYDDFFIEIIIVFSVPFILKLTMNRAVKGVIGHSKTSLTSATRKNQSLKSTTEKMYEQRHETGDNKFVVSSEEIPYQGRVE